MERSDLQAMILAEGCEGNDKAKATETNMGYVIMGYVWIWDYEK
jgi:hypothetical protein